MLIPSFIRAPSAPVRFSLSDPAKSTSVSFEVNIPLLPVVDELSNELSEEASASLPEGIFTFRVQIACDRLLYQFR